MLTGLSGGGNGCASIDLSFENLTLTGGTGTNGFVAPVAGNTTATTSGSGVTANIPNTATLTFAPSTPGNWDATTSDTTPGSFGFTVTYFASIHEGGSYTGGTYPSPSGGMHWFFNTVTAGISGSVGNAITGTQSISVITSFCLGATTMATCGGSGANFGTLTANIAENASPVLGCGTGSTANYTCSGGVLDISNAQYVTQIAFSTVVTANHIAALGTGAQTVDLNNFSLAFTQFAEAPEPGSYILMGSGLAALGFIARRRRRQA